MEDKTTYELGAGMNHMKKSGNKQRPRTGDMPPEKGEHEGYNWSNMYGATYILGKRRNTSGSGLR